jgi:hypothetical protein
MNTLKTDSVSHSHSHATTDGRSVSQSDLVSSPSSQVMTRPAVSFGAPSDNRADLSNSQFLSHVHNYTHLHTHDTLCTAYQALLDSLSHVHNYTHTYSTYTRMTGSAQHIRPYSTACRTYTITGTYSTYTRMTRSAQHIRPYSTACPITAI